MFGELWFHAGDKSLPPECRHTKHEMQGEVAEIENIVKENGDIRGDTLTMLAKLTDHTGSVRYINDKLGDSDEIYLVQV